jgi:hypothetical protein
LGIEAKREARRKTPLTPNAEGETEDNAI